MQQGCLNKSLLFLLVLSLVLCLVACDLSAIVNELKDLRNNNNAAESSQDASFSENVDNSFIGGDSSDSDEISFTVIPGEGSSLVVSGDGVSTENYSIVDGYLVSGDGTVIGKVEVLESEGKFVWAE